MVLLDLQSNWLTAGIDLFQCYYNSPVFLCFCISRSNSSRSSLFKNQFTSFEPNSKLTWEPIHCKLNSMPHDTTNPFVTYPFFCLLQSICLIHIFLMSHRYQVLRAREKQLKPDCWKLLSICWKHQSQYRYEFAFVGSCLFSSSSLENALFLNLELLSPPHRTL